MKTITKEQIDMIIQSFYEINAPIKLYVGIKDMLEKLPESPIMKDEKGLDKKV